MVTVGNLLSSEVIKARNYALATATKPLLGSIGFFILVTAATLASTSSVINATLHGTARASYMVAKYGQLLKAAKKRIWRQAYEGLLAINVLSLILSNTASLEMILATGSGGFLTIFSS